MSQIRDAIEAMEQMQANNDRLAEASCRLEQVESDVRRLRQSHTDLLTVLQAAPTIYVDEPTDSVMPGFADRYRDWLRQARAAIRKAE